MICLVCLSLIVTFKMVRTELYTAGGQFNRPDGTEYIGAYHVHITRGAMVGGFHKIEAHDRLIPIDQAAVDLIESIMDQLRSERVQQASIRSLSSGTSTPSGSGGSGGY